MGPRPASPFSSIFLSISQLVSNGRVTSIPLSSRKIARRSRPIENVSRGRGGGTRAEAAAVEAPLRSISRLSFLSSEQIPRLLFPASRNRRETRSSCLPVLPSSRCLQPLHRFPRSVSLAFLRLDGEDRDSRFAIRGSRFVVVFARRYSLRLLFALRSWRLFKQSESGQ